MEAQNRRGIADQGTLRPNSATKMLSSDGYFHVHSDSNRGVYERAFCSDKGYDTGRIRCNVWGWQMIVRAFYYSITALAAIYFLFLGASLNYAYKEVHERLPIEQLKSAP